MSQTETEIRELEESNKESQEWIKLEQALERLHKNRDFKAVISEGYFKDNAVRLVHLKASPAMSSPQMQAVVEKEIDAIGGLINYFRKIYFEADQAREAIRSNEETIMELRQEELSREGN